MNRRDWLAGISSACFGLFAGCSQLGRTTDPRKIASLRASTNSEMITAVSSIENDKIDDDEQGSVRLGVKLEDDSEVELRYGSTIPISPPRMSKKPEGLVLLDEDTEADRKNENTWITAGPPFPHSLEMNTQTFERGDMVSKEYAIWGSDEHFRRIPPGSYNFEDDSMKLESNDDLLYTVDIKIIRL